MSELMLRRDVLRLGAVTGVAAAAGLAADDDNAAGKAAPGGELDYMSHGKLTGGFALVAYPEQWDKSGIMTFIVNQDGKIYQSNLGEKTSRLAEKLTEYNPDSSWTLVQDQGLVDAVSEK